MVVNYQNGKIYKLHCLSSTDDKCYIGSTTQTLALRFGEHKKGYKKWKEGKQHYTTSYYLFDTFVDDIVITLIESYPCKSKNELEARERHWIEKMNCVNKRIPTQTNKEYIQKNKEKISKQLKEHYEKNKETYAINAKEYREKNKEKIKENNKEYHQKNREKILQKMKEYREKKK